MTEYRIIPGFDAYRVGDDGSVQSRKIAGRTNRLSESWMTLKSVIDCATGYASVSLRKDGRTFRRSVHRLVLEAFVGLCPPGMQGCHGDGNRANNRRDNLRWDTQAGNEADKIAHGTSNRGTRNWMSKLTPEDIPEILAVREQFPTATMEEIGILFGVSKLTISGILRGDNWSWLTGIKPGDHKTYGPGATRKRAPRTAQLG